MGLPLNTPNEAATQLGEVAYAFAPETQTSLNLTNHGARIYNCTRKDGVAVHVPGKR
jgi:hypothetical protein